MATIKQFVVTVTDVTNKENPFVTEAHTVRAKSKSAAADKVWQRLAQECIVEDRQITAEEAKNLAARHFRLTIDLRRSVTAVGYQDAATRDASRAKARKKAAAKKAAAGKTSGNNGKVKTHKLAS